MTNFIPSRVIRINDPNSNDCYITFTREWNDDPIDNPIITKYANCVIIKIFCYNDEISLLIEKEREMTKRQAIKYLKRVITRWTAFNSAHPKLFKALVELLREVNKK